jgi:hypothetical protein
MTLSRIAGAKIVESWVYWDTFGLLQQLGVVPTIFKELPGDEKLRAEWKTA